MQMYLNTNTFEKYYKYFFKYFSFSGYIYYIGKRNKTIYQAVHLVYCYCLSCLVTFSGLVSIWLLPSVQCSLLPSSLFPRVTPQEHQLLESVVCEAASLWAKHLPSDAEKPFNWSRGCRDAFEKVFDKYLKNQIL